MQKGPREEGAKRRATSTQKRSPAQRRGRRASSVSRPFPSPFVAFPLAQPVSLSLRAFPPRSPYSARPPLFPLLVSPHFPLLAPLSILTPHLERVDALAGRPGVLHQVHLCEFQAEIAAENAKPRAPTRRTRTHPPARPHTPTPSSAGRFSALDSCPIQLEPTSPTRLGFFSISARFFDFSADFLGTASISVVV